MLIRLILLFTLIPLIELAILLHLGSIIGVWYTILVVIITGTVGALLARRQGVAVVGRMRSSMSQGLLPGEELLHGLLVLAGGLLLLTPGLLTDLVGFLLLIPRTRVLALCWLKRMFERRINEGQVQYWQLR